MTALVEFREVDRDFGARQAVRKLSFELADHECVGLVGLNGAGKTTTLRMLAGLCAPSRGTIWVRGERMLPGAHALRAHVGFLPERAPLYEAMTVSAFLLFAAEVRGLAAGERAGAVLRAIEATQLGRVRDERISALSHGYRQRVGIAQAIVHAPALLILDEPSQGLDPAQGLAMQELVRELKQQHSVLLSTHLLRDVKSCCDRVLLLHEGALIGQGSEAELAARFVSGPRSIVIEARGDRAALTAALANVPSVQDIVVRADEPTLILEVQALVDVRAALSRCVVESGADLLGLSSQEAGFDALFTALREPAEKA